MRFSEKLGQQARDGSAFKKTFIDFDLRSDSAKIEGRQRVAGKIRKIFEVKVK